jgi:hypothetical protein
VSSARFVVEDVECDENKKWDDEVDARNQEERIYQGDRQVRQLRGERWITGN